MASNSLVPEYEKPIVFTAALGEHEYLWDLYRSPFKLMEHTYRCAFDYFSSMKMRFYDESEKEAQHLREKMSGDKNNKTSPPLQFDTEVWLRDVQYKVAQEAMYLKFMTAENAEQLQAQLLATGTRELIYAGGIHENFWGVGLELVQAHSHQGPWPGENVLGRTLVKVREHLRIVKSQQQQYLTFTIKLGSPPSSCEVTEATLEPSSKKRLLNNGASVSTAAATTPSTSTANSNQGSLSYIRK